jgi:hypothetical protein
MQDLSSTYAEVIMSVTKSSSENYRRFKVSVSLKHESWLPNQTTKNINRANSMSLPR